jgi:hypothetical protein
LWAGDEIICVIAGSVPRVSGFCDKAIPITGGGDIAKEHRRKIARNDTRNQSINSAVQAILRQ